jgi:triphosphoribosyl-dephospho-CoA synthase
MLSEFPDTFIAKKFGDEISEMVRQMSAEVRGGVMSVEVLDAFCLEKGYNPGSLADIMISGLYIAIGEGWLWD